MSKTSLLGETEEKKKNNTQKTLVAIGEVCVI